MTSLDYRYGMNSQEKNGEIAAGVYTAEFWGYNSQLGRRWNQDPVVIPGVSPYASFANDPLFFVDRKGNKVDPNSQKEWDGHKQFTKDRLTSLEAERDKLEGRLFLGKKNKARLEYVNQSINELNGALQEMEAMENDQTLTYHLESVNSNDQRLYNDSKQVYDNGVTSQDPSGNVTILYTGRANLAHELKHGYQYISGDLDRLRVLHDSYDEMTAFNRGYAYDESYRGFTNYGDVNQAFVHNI